MCDTRTSVESFAPVSASVTFLMLSYPDNRFSAARTKLQERSARQRPSRSTWCSGGPLAIRGFSYGWSLMRPEVCVCVLVDHHAHTDQVEQETHVAAVGSAFRRLGLIAPPHLAQVPYVPSDIRFRAASI